MAKEVSDTVPNAAISHPAHSAHSASATHSSVAAPQKKEKEVQISISEECCGYIFMCNGNTKPECFQYRVFGLPKGKRDIVEKIKPGMKLFLFDFEEKHLYGIYEATCCGKMNLEPDAFGGKFPAQVKFGIHKGCCPLPEKDFRKAIEANYNGPKFNQQLNAEQVESLVSLFRPLSAPSSESTSRRSAYMTSAPPGQLSGLKRVREYGSENYPYGGSLGMVHGRPREEQRRAYSGPTSYSNQQVGLQAQYLHGNLQPTTTLNDYLSIIAAIQRYGSVQEAGSRGSGIQREALQRYGSTSAQEMIARSSRQLTPVDVYTPSTLQNYGSEAEAVYPDQQYVPVNPYNPLALQRYESVQDTANAVQQFIPQNGFNPIVLQRVLERYAPKQEMVPIDQQYIPQQYGYYPAALQMGIETVQQPAANLAYYYQHQPAASNTIEPVQLHSGSVLETSRQAVYKTNGTYGN